MEQNRTVSLRTQGCHELLAKCRQFLMPAGQARREFMTKPGRVSADDRRRVA